MYIIVHKPAQAHIPSVCFSYQITILDSFVFQWLKLKQNTTQSSHWTKTQKWKMALLDEHINSCPSPYSENWALSMLYMHASYTVCDNNKFFFFAVKGKIKWLWSLNTHSPTTTQYCVMKSSTKTIKQALPILYSTPYVIFIHCINVREAIN